MPYHILNGDALKDHFSSDIVGQIIVLREALVDGPIQAVTLDEMYELRAKYIMKIYGPEEGFYSDRVVPEFKKVLDIPKEETVYLWFEDDLFCQMNMWFAVHLLYTSHQPEKVFWVRPKDELQFGFAAYRPEDLSGLMEDARALSEKEIEIINNMWLAVQFDDLNELELLSESLPVDLKYLRDVVEARKEQKSAKPDFLIRKIIDETGATTFGPVFQEFVKKYPIYGFGDLQVKRIYDRVSKM